jgi:hypothetical protein
VLEAVLLVLLGLGVGVFGAIIGAGGGFLLVPILLLAYPDRDPATVTAISLAVVFANASSGAVAYAWQKRIDYRSGIWWALAAIPGALGGAVLVGIIPRDVFVVVFAVALAGVATHLILRRRATGLREPITGRGAISRRIRDRQGQNFFYTFRLWHGLTIAGAMGFLSGLLGAGGGVLQVPLLTIILRFPVHIATATSQFAYALIALEATTVHLVTGGLHLDEHLVEAAFIAAGAVVGAQVGAGVANRIRGAVILRVLSAALLLVAAWLFVDALVR